METTISASSRCLSRQFALIAPISPFEVKPGVVEHMPLFLLRDPTTIRDRHETVTVRVRDGGEWSEEISTEFVSGGPQ